MTRDIAGTRVHVSVANVMLTVFQILHEQRVEVVGHARTSVACYT
jgi:hypothetical protein